MTISYKDKVRLMALALKNCEHKERLCLTVALHSGKIKGNAKFFPPNVVILQEVVDGKDFSIVPALAREMNVAHQYQKMGWFFFLLCSIPGIREMTIQKEAKGIEKEVRKSLKESGMI